MHGEITNICYLCRDSDAFAYLFSKGLKVTKNNLFTTFTLTYFIVMDTLCSVYSMNECELSMKITYFASHRTKIVHKIHFRWWRISLLENWKTFSENVKRGNKKNVYGDKLKTHTDHTNQINCIFRESFISSSQMICKVPDRQNVIVLNQMLT